MTEEQLYYLRGHFSTTMNCELCDVLRVSPSTLHRMARKLGLKKEDGFLDTNRQRISDMATNAKRLNGTLHLRPANACNANWLKHSIKPGECLMARLPEEKRKAAYAKMGKTRRQRRVYKLKRLLYGLEVTGKERIRLEGKAYIVRESSVRSRMRRYGYVVERASKVAYYSDQTHRVASLEKTAGQYGIDVVGL